MNFHGFCYLLHILAWFLLLTHSYSDDGRKTYIVYMGDHQKDVELSESLHIRMLQNILGSKYTPDTLLHSYKKSFNGFVAKLTEEEAVRMEGLDGVVSVFQNKKNELHTTRSWDFIGLSQTVKRTNTESNIIVGVIDNGIWPESDSFDDQGFGPPPQKWKGSCQNFTCNNKIIGAKYFHMNGPYGKEDLISPRDSKGHGTHCASTAAGNSVEFTSFFGLASGTARGGVPSARIAVYKPCWSSGCDDADILHAFDEAIEDGVDIISLSLGPTEVQHNNYFNDIFAIGAFHAMKKGILTSTSAGNSGPEFYTVSKNAPWLLSVAASTIDRKFFTSVQLGDGTVYISLCLENSLDENVVKGKIVLCDGFLDPASVGLVSGAAGILLRSSTPKDNAFTFALPAVHLSLEDGALIQSYINLTSNPTATIFKSNEGKDSLAPYIASFSSRGPNAITPNILKPDLAAPGVDILAAWSPIMSVSDVKEDERKTKYSINSGTSMACPHATAAAAYIKSFHPDWSPAAIKSALMTTATPMSVQLNPEAEFAYGAGQINPIKALNPGLVYDANETDYVNFLCGHGYDTKKLKSITKDSSKCTQTNNGMALDLNLPSFALSINSSTPFHGTFHRTVTNVGSNTSTYKARVTALPPSLSNFKVEPDVISFSSVGQKKSFTLSIEGTLNVEISSSFLIWDDGTFQVRSPIVLFLPQM